MAAANQSIMADNVTMSTAATELPPLPSYTLIERPNLISWFPDALLSIFAPIAAYWIVSVFFHVIDEYDVWPQYRLHTPAEISQRNRATRYEVFRDVIFQQVIQAGMSFALDILDPPQTMGKEDYDVAVWATRIRLAQRAFPAILRLLGLNAAAISKNMSVSHPLLAGVLAGGHYPFLTTSLAGPDGSFVPAFASWELVVAKAIYHIIIPAIQFIVAVVFLDTWQYFLHRSMHMNKWLYSMRNPVHHPF